MKSTTTGLAILFPLLAGIIIGVYGIGKVWIEAKITPERLLVCQDNCPFDSIQAAIDAALPVFSNAIEDLPVIEIQPGVYRENLLIQKSVILQGVESHPNQIIIESAKENRPVVQVQSTSPNAVFVVLKGLTIARATGIEADGVQVFGRLTRTGEIRGLTLLMLNIIVEENEQAGVSAFGGASIELRGVTIRNNAMGLVAADQATAYVDGSLFVKNELAIGLGNEATAIVSRNTIRSSGTHALVIESTGRGSEIRVVGNIIEETGESAVLVFGSRPVLLEENQIRLSLEHGIEVYFGGDSSAVHGLINNIIEENAGHGVSIMGEGGSLSLIRNIIRKNERFGVVVDNPDVIFFCWGNRVEENQEGDYGVRVESYIEPDEQLRARCGAP